MTLTEMIIIVVLIIIGLALVGSWIFSSRSFSWTFLLSIFLYIVVWLEFIIRDWKALIGTSILFIGIAHIYIYDLYFSYYRATRRGRR